MPIETESGKITGANNGEWGWRFDKPLAYKKCSHTKLIKCIQDNECGSCDILKMAKSK